MRVHDSSFSHIIQQLFFLRDPKTAPEYPLVAVEDISPLMSCYGYEANPTPHLDDWIRETDDKAGTPKTDPI
ncbi:MAG: hypothetical protein KJ768_04840 [Acidobacteria bacterium]|nr:hypothetical protein [Acidobacteriota bacterium]